jgi:flagellin
MAQYINTNSMSLTAQRNLNTSMNASQTAMQRLSSGLRINSAKDDAAGLSIANRFNAQVRGLNQASRNANDGISLAQTAEGSLGEITNNLQRLRELAVQSANATNSVSDRAALQQEAGQLLQEVDRVAGQTNFNGAKLLDGSFKAQVFQVGANAGETISIDLNAATTAKLGVSDTASVAAVSTANSIVEGDLIINGKEIGASFANTDTASVYNVSASAIAKAAAINAKSSLTGVSATVDANVAEGSAMTAGSVSTGFIMINGISTATITTTSSTSVSRAAVVQGINAISNRTGVMARDTGNDLTGVELTALDGRNITVGSSGLSAISTGITGVGPSISLMSFANMTTNYGSFSLSSGSASKDITIQRGSTIGLETNAGLTAGTFKAQTASVSTVANTGANILAGDVKINSILIGASQASSDTASFFGNSGSAIAKVAAINAAGAGVTATVNTNVVNGTAVSYTVSTGTLVINGVTTANIATSSTDTSATRTNVVTAINAISGRTGVTAVDDGAKGVKLLAVDGRNITVAFSGSFAAASDAGVAATTNYGTFSLNSTKAIKIESGTTDSQLALVNTNLSLGTYGSTKTGESLDKLDISTFEGATKALASIDNALASIDSNRSTLGAVQNRFVSTIASLQVNAENLTTAKGRIMDADFAAETSNMTKANVLLQAGMTILSQANQNPQQVLALLR